MFPDTVIVLRAPLVETAYGVSRDWGNARSAGRYRANIQIHSRADKTPDKQPDLSKDRETVATAYRAFLRGPVDVTTQDRIRWAGRDYEIVGTPEPRPFPPSLRHTVLTIRRLDG